MSDKKRARHVASDEAHAWARSLQLHNPNAKSVLRALTLYVNGEASCFVSIEQLAEDTDLSMDTVRRRLVWLESISAIVRLPQWLDPNGRRNSDGKGKRTTDEIRLLLSADIDEIEAKAKGFSDETSPSREPPQDFTSEEVSPAPALSQPSQSCEVLTSEPEPEESPQPPSGGAVDLDGWKEFEEAWEEPILRQSLAQQVWAALKPDEQNLAKRAARGYVAWRRSQKRPPNVLAAHRFLKERDAWEKFAALVSTATLTPNKGTYDPKSREGIAIVAMYAVARTEPLKGDRWVRYPGEITPRVLAFAGVAEKLRDVWIEDRQQIGAWTRFLAEHVHRRAELIDTRGIGANTRTGIWAPHPWPPKVDGTWSPTGDPPQAETLMSEQDMADFH